MTQLLMTSIVIFGVLSYSRIFAYTATLTIIRPRRVEASIIGINYEFITVDLQTIIDIVVLVSLITAIGIIIYLTFARKHEITTHFGRGIQRDDNDMGWTLVICIVQTTITFCSVRTENIYLRIPITVFKRIRVRDIRIVSPLITWSIKTNNGNKFFAINEDVNLFHLDVNGNNLGNKWQKVYFKIGDIQYTHEPRPILFNSKNSYGTAILSVARDLSTSA